MKPDHLKTSSSIPADVSAARPACRPAAKCDTHRGESMIHLEYINRAESVQTVPVVCMHCEEPTCAECARQTRSSGRSRGGAISAQAALRGVRNCVMACPFGVPEVIGRARPDDEVRHVLRPDGSIGKKPMCATVCPRQRSFMARRKRSNALAADVGADQWLRIRPADDYDARIRDGAARPGDASGRDGRARRGRSPPGIDQGGRGCRSVRPKWRSEAPPSLIETRSRVPPDGRPADEQPAWRQDFPSIRRRFS